MSQQVHNHLSFFRNLLTCSHEIYMWTFDHNLELLSSNCPDKNTILSLMMLDHSREILLTQIKKQYIPLELTNSLGLIWIIAPEYTRDTEKLQKIHAIGPALYSDISTQNINTVLNRYSLSLPLKIEYVRCLEHLPVISLTRFKEYGLMLHYCITGEKITASDMRICENTSRSQELTSVELIEHHGTWNAEQEILKLVEEGNIHYKHKIDQLVSIGNIGKMSNGDPLRQAKNTVIIFTALCARSAVRGGLSSETAFSLSDKYLQNVEACNSLSQIEAINGMMFDDYIQRVHQCKSMALSPLIKECCDYISLHIEKQINIEELAYRFGYSKYYFSRKFKSETGLSIHEYIKKSKLKKAKDLLLSEKYSIREISEMLGFHSPSHFGELFHKMTGMTPGEFRNKH